jgi:hypothetical protein
MVVCKGRFSQPSSPFFSHRLFCLVQRLRPGWARLNGCDLIDERKASSKDDSEPVICPCFPETVETATMHHRLGLLCSEARAVKFDKFDLA